MFALRDFRPEDASEVSLLARVAWEYVYRDIYSPSYIADFVDRFYCVSALEAALEGVRRGDAQFTVATDEAGPILGFCHVGRDMSWDLELYRIYLHPQVIGRGVGSLLLKRAEAFVASTGADRYHCYVHRLNHIGRGFYERKGFVYILARGSNEECYLEKVLPRAAGIANTADAE